MYHGVLLPQSSAVNHYFPQMSVRFRYTARRHIHEDSKFGRNLMNKKCCTFYRFSRQLLFISWSCFGSLRRGGYMYMYGIYIYCFVHHNILWNNQQMQLYAVNYITLLSSLYMFRAPHTPIIRSTISLLYSVLYGRCRHIVINYASLHTISNLFIIFLSPLQPNSRLGPNVFGVCSTDTHTAGRTPPNEWSARRRDRYLHNTN